MINMCFYLTISISLILSYLINSTTIRVAVIAVSLLYLVVTDAKTSFAFIAFSIPFASIFKIRLHTTSYISYFILIYLFKCLIIKSIKLEKNALLVWLCFLILSTLSTWKIGFDADFIQFQASLFLILLIASNGNKLYNFREVNFAFVFGVLTASISAKILYNVPWMFDLWKEAYIDGVRRFCGLEYDPNFYSVLLLVTISICILFIFKENRLWPYGPIGLALVVIGFSTLSKTYFLGLLIVFVISIRRIKKISSKLKLAGTTVFTILAISIISNQYIQTLLNRFNDASSLNTLTTGRLDIQLIYITMILNNYKTFLVGHGLNKNAIFLEGIMYTAHNTYLQILFYVGIIGFFILGIYFTCLFYPKKERNTFDLSMLPIIIFTITMFTLDFTFNDYVPIIVCLFLVNLSEYEKEEMINNAQY